MVCGLCSAATTQTAEAPATPPVQAAEAVIETPENVASRYMEATRRTDWKTCAALMHPDALIQLKQIFRPLVATGQEPKLGVLFFNVRTVAEFERLSGQEAFERLMAFFTKLSPEISSAIKTSQSNIIGHVLEGNDMAHVVYRMTMKTQGVSVTKLAIMPLKKSGTAWKGMLTGDIEGLAAAFSDRKAPQPVAKPSIKKTPNIPAPKLRRK